MKQKDIKSRLDSLQKGKGQAAGDPGKVISGIIRQEQESPDFDKIADELQQRHQDESRGLNDGYIKDTIYIREDLYRAFNALCTERGMKKQYANEAIADFVKKKYKEIQGNMY